jgi:hypothetical protein
MEKSKLIRLLMLLPSKDLDAFKTYLKTPFFNQRESLAYMLDELEKAFILRTHPGSKEAIYQAVYGDKPLNESSLKTSMTQLLGLLMDFIAFSQFQKDKIRQNHYVLEKLNLIGEEKQFPNYYAKAAKDIQKAKLETADRNYELMRLEEELNDFVSRQPRRDPDDQLRKGAEYLGNSFLLRLLRYHLQAVDRASSFKNPTSTPLAETVLDYLASNLEDQSAIIQVYFLLARAHQDPLDLKSFSDAKALLSTFWKDFAWVEAYELYTSALNFAARQLNNGHLEFLQLVFNIYKEMLERGLLSHEGKMSAWHFKNMVNVGLRLQEFDWVDNLIATWQNKIDPDHAKNAFHFNQGMLRYYQRQYKVAARHFNKVLADYKDIFYALNSRGYLLQIFYENDNLGSLETNSHSFRMFLDRNTEISTEKRRQYIAFLNHMSRLAGIPDFHHARLEKLRAEILKKDHKGMGSAWLLEKITEKEKPTG